MVSVSDLNLQYTATSGSQSGNQNIAETAAKAIADTLITALISGGGAKEVAAAGTREAKNVTDNAEATSNINLQMNLYTTALQTITQMAQTGQLDINNFQNLLTQVVNSITDNNTQVEQMDEQIQTITKENENIKAELESLTGGSVEDYLANNDTTTRDNQTSTESARPGSMATPTFRAQNEDSSNPNSSRIEELLNQLNLNNDVIASLQTSIADIAANQTSLVDQGQNIKSQTENKHSSVVSSVQNYAQQAFSDFASRLGDMITQGVQTQQANSAEGLTQQTSDEEAAATLLAKAATEGTGGLLGGLLTGGLGAILGGAAAAKDSAEAGLFTSAAGINGALSGTALANIPILQQVGNTLGTTVAQNLSQSTNSLLQGAITETTNNILGTDLASMISEKINERLGNQEDKA